MKKINIFPFFTKNKMSVIIPVKMKNTQFYIKVDFSKKYDLIHFYINKKLDDITLSHIREAYKEYLNDFTDLHLWNIKRIFHLLYKLLLRQVFDFRKMKMIDFITTISSIDNKINKDIARTIKINGEMITIINSNESYNKLTTNLDFHYLNFQLLNTLINIDLGSSMNNKNIDIIKKFIRIGILVIFNLPILATLFTCISNKKIVDYSFECFGDMSNNILYLNIILTITSSILWFVIPKIIQIAFRNYLKKFFKEMHF